MLYKERKVWNYIRIKWDGVKKEIWVPYLQDASNKEKDTDS